MVIFHSYVKLPEGTMIWYIVVAMKIIMIYHDWLFWSFMDVYGLFSYLLSGYLT